KTNVKIYETIWVPIAILNTIDRLGKFDGKADERFFVGYSLNSKAFRVFNSRTRIMEGTLHIRFSENTPNNVGSGPNWMFDIDALTKTMNYQPVVASTQSNGNAGTKDNNNAGQARKEKEPLKITSCYHCGLLIHLFHKSQRVLKMMDLNLLMMLETRNKMDERGIVIRNKTRLVAQGHIQKEGLCGVPNGCEEFFLYGKIEEEVYVFQPSGIKDLDFLNKVYKVEKAL
nr:retrovirus-related Pol polyprotein from transposon TNT 1-94 [Tanacetum cinerariifolium]